MKDSAADLSRYSRQMLFAQVGEAGQRRLLDASIAVVGCGATGCGVAALLARAGVGKIHLIDRDLVEWSNLQRQTLYTERDVKDGLPKAVAAERRLRRVNSKIAIQARVADLNTGNVEALIGDVDLVMDGSDNLDTRYLVNDLCVRDRRPWVYSGVVASYGMVMPIRPGESACFRCLFPEPPPPGGPTCDTAGVLGSAVQAVSAIAAAEAVKLLIGDYGALAPGLVTLDIWDHQYSVSSVNRRPNCPCCIQRDFSFLHAASGVRTTSLCGRDAVQVTPGGTAAAPLAEVAQRLARLTEVNMNDFLLRARIDGHDLTLFQDGRAIIHGTSDEAAARSFYARYVGS